MAIPQSPCATNVQTKLNAVDGLEGLQKIKAVCDLYQSIYECFSGSCGLDRCEVVRSARFIRTSYSKLCEINNDMHNIVSSPENDACRTEWFKHGFYQAFTQLMPQLMHPNTGTYADAHVGLR